MIKHKHCSKEFKKKLETRFIAFRCLTKISFDNTKDRINIHIPFVAEQVYQNQIDLQKNELCQTEVFCPECQVWDSINGFELYTKCDKCKQKNIKVANVYCRKQDRSLKGCYQCIKKHCTETCPKRGLCGSYREILYRLEDTGNKEYD